MIKKIKKGFTLIELVVVIAVIAILAAVSVVSYVAITNKAKESNDHMVIDQVNTALAGSSILSKKATVHEIVDSLVKEEGFDVRQIKPELKDTKFVYLYEENTFGYWKDGKVVYPKSVEGKGSEAGNDIWFFEDTAAANYADGYSHYLKQATVGLEITVDGGLDVGTCDGISTIHFKRTSKAQKNVVIRTASEGTSLVVNAPEDTVKHYGPAGLVTLTAVGSSSYYENGSVNQVNIKKGRLVISNSAESAINTILLQATNDGYDDIILATQSGAELPEMIARDSVSAPSGTDTKKVVTIQTNVNAYGSNPEKVETINLYSTAGSTGNDVYEASSGYNVSPLGLLVVEASSNEAKAQAAEQISNPEIVEKVTEQKSACEVDSQAKMEAALEAKAKYIIVTASFDTTKAFIVKSSSIIEGAKLSDGSSPVITSKATAASEKRGFRVSESNIGLTLRDLSVDVRSSVTSDSSYPRGLQIDSNIVGIKLVVENCDISATHYAFNVCNGADVDATISNSHLLGYGALNLWHANYHVKVANSVLEGVQNNREAFGVIVLEGDVTGQTSAHSSSITVEVDNSELIATCNNTTGGYEAFVGFNSKSVANTVSLNNCKFTSKGAGITKVYYNYGEANTLLLDGSEVMLKNIQVDFSGVTINEDGKTAVGTVKFTINGSNVSYNLSSATVSDWGDGTDYLFDYKLGSVKYVLDLDISTSSYSENNGWALYISSSF